MTSLKTRMRRTTIGLLLATSLLGSAGIASAQSAFTQLDRTAEAKISFSSSDRGTPILAGSTVKVSGEGYKAGQTVKLLYGTTAIPNGELKADAEGKIEGTITIPANAEAGKHPIVVVAEGPYNASVSTLKVSPTVPLSGQANYDVVHAQVARGLYQSAYSAKNNALFVTSAVGRPPVTQSEIVKLNADTLKVLARITPAEAPARPGAPAQTPDGKPAPKGVFAVYGIGVDDANGHIWVTNTRHDTVAVYKQSDLSLVKQFPPKSVTHGRDVVVDTAANRVYISTMLTPDVAVFNATTLEQLAPITIPTKARGRDKAFSAASLSFDAKAKRLYVAGFSTAEVAVVNTDTQKVENVFAVPGAEAVIGVAHDSVTDRIFAVAQGTDNLVVLDGKDGKVIADTPIGAGALNVVFDPVKRRAYVSNRGAGTVAVVDVDGKILANLGPAPLVNHATLGKNGVVYAVDKSAGVKDADNDTIMRIRPKR